MDKIGNKLFFRTNDKEQERDQPRRIMLGGQTLRKSAQQEAQDHRGRSA